MVAYANIITATGFTSKKVDISSVKGPSEKICEVGEVTDKEGTEDSSTKVDISSIKGHPKTVDEIEEVSDKPLPDKKHEEGILTEVDTDSIHFNTHNIRGLSKTVDEVEEVSEKPAPKESPEEDASTNVDISSIKGPPDNVSEVELSDKTASEESPKGDTSTEATTNKDTSHEAAKDARAQSVGYANIITATGFTSTSMDYSSVKGPTEGVEKAKETEKPEVTPVEELRYPRFVAVDSPPKSPTKAQIKASPKTRTKISEHFPADTKKDLDSDLKHEVSKPELLKKPALKEQDNEKSFDEPEKQVMDKMPEESEVIHDTNEGKEQYTDKIQEKEIPRIPLLDVPSSTDLSDEDPAKVKTTIEAVSITSHIDNLPEEKLHEGKHLPATEQTKESLQDEPHDRLTVIKAEPCDTDSFHDSIKEGEQISVSTSSTSVKDIKESRQSGAEENSSDICQAHPDDIHSRTSTNGTETSTTQEAYPVPTNVDEEKEENDISPSASTATRIIRLDEKEITHENAVVTPKPVTTETERKEDITEDKIKEPKPSGSEAQNNERVSEIGNSHPETGTIVTTDSEEIHDSSDKTEPKNVKKEKPESVMSSKITTTTTVTQGDTEFNDLTDNKGAAELADQRVSTDNGFPVKDYSDSISKSVITTVIRREGDISDEYKNKKIETMESKSKYDEGWLENGDSHSETGTVTTTVTSEYHVVTDKIDLKPMDEEKLESDTTISKIMTPPTISQGDKEMTDGDTSFISKTGTTDTQREDDIHNEDKSQDSDPTEQNAQPRETGVSHDQICTDTSTIITHTPNDIDGKKSTQKKGVDTEWSEGEKSYSTTHITHGGEEIDSPTDTQDVKHVSKNEGNLPESVVHGVTESPTSMTIKGEYKNSEMLGEDSTQYAEIVDKKETSDTVQREEEVATALLGHGEPDPENLLKTNITHDDRETPHVTDTSHITDDDLGNKEEAAVPQKLGVTEMIEPLPENTGSYPETITVTPSFTADEFIYDGKMATPEPLKSDVPPDESWLPPETGPTSVNTETHDREAEPKNINREKPESDKSSSKTGIIRQSDREISDLTNIHDSSHVIRDDKDDQEPAGLKDSTDPEFPDNSGSLTISETVITTVKPREDDLDNEDMNQDLIPKEFKSQPDKELSESRDSHDETRTVTKTVITETSNVTDENEPIPLGKHGNDVDAELSESNESYSTTTKTTTIITYHDGEITSPTATQDAEGIESKNEEKIPESLEPTDRGSKLDVKTSSDSDEPSVLKTTSTTIIKSDEDIKSETLDKDSKPLPTMNQPDEEWSETGDSYSETKTITTTSTRQVDGKTELSNGGESFSKTTTVITAVTEGEKGVSDEVKSVTSEPPKSKPHSDQQLSEIGDSNSVTKTVTTTVTRDHDVVPHDGSDTKEAEIVADTKGTVVDNGESYSESTIVVRTVKEDERAVGNEAKLGTPEPLESKPPSDKQKESGDSYSVTKTVTTTVTGDHTEVPPGDLDTNEAEIVVEPKDTVVDDGESYSETTTVITTGTEDERDVGNEAKLVTPEPLESKTPSDEQWSESGDSYSATKTVTTTVTGDHTEVPHGGLDTNEAETVVETEDTVVDDGQSHSKSTTVITTVTEDERGDGNEAKLGTPGPLESKQPPDEQWSESGDSYSVTKIVTTTVTRDHAADAQNGLDTMQSETVFEPKDTVVESKEITDTNKSDGDELPMAKEPSRDNDEEWSESGDSYSVSKTIVTTVTKGDSEIRDKNDSENIRVVEPESSLDKGWSETGDSYSETRTVTTTISKQESGISDRDRVGDRDSKDAVKHKEQNETSDNGWSDSYTETRTIVTSTVEGTGDSSTDTVKPKEQNETSDSGWSDTYTETRPIVTTSSVDGTGDSTSDTVVPKEQKETSDSGWSDTYKETRTIVTSTVDGTGDSSRDTVKPKEQNETSDSGWSDSYTETRTIVTTSTVDGTGGISERDRVDDRDSKEAVKHEEQNETSDSGWSDSYTKTRTIVTTSTVDGTGDSSRDDKTYGTASKEGKTPKAVADEESYETGDSYSKTTTITTKVEQKTNVMQERQQVRSSVFCIVCV